MKIIILPLALLMIPQAGLARQKGKHGSAGDVQQEIRQVEHDEAAVWTSRPDGAALATINRVLADDFVCLCDGIEVTKKQAVADFRSGDSKIEFLKPGKMKIRIFGSAAVVTGSDDRKGSYKGKEYSGHYVWTDVLVKRQGHWQEVAAHMNRESLH